MEGKNKSAFYISAISSPFLVIALFSLITIYHYSPAFSSFLLWGGISLLLSILLPLIYVLTRVKSGTITDVHVSLKEQRRLPFLVALAGSALVAIIFYYIKAPSQLVAMNCALLINGAIFLTITKYWKISLHASSFTSSVVIVGLLVSPNYFWFFLVLPFIVWARIARGKHTFGQLAVGALLSAAITALVLMSF